MRMSTKRKYKEVPNRNHKAEKYNNYTEKFNRVVQQKTNEWKNGSATSKRGQ